MILEVNNARYLLEKRKAREGERILLNHDPLRITDVVTVYGMTVVDKEGKENFHHNYIVMTELIECETCNGSGFSTPGTGYNAICDTCAGRGEYPA